MTSKEINSSPDWHSEDIKAAVRKKGVSMAELARANGYEKTRTFMNVLRAPYPKVQKIIADFLDTPAEEIWPSRYREPTKIKPFSHRKVA